VKAKIPNPPGGALGPLAVVFSLTLCLALALGATGLRAQGCEDYPDLDDAWFVHLVRIMDLAYQEDAGAKLEDYAAQNNLDMDEVLLAVTKLDANMNEQLDPESTDLEDNFGECAGKVRYSEEEARLFRNHLPEFQVIAMQN
jgi:hypothetical protein